MHRSASLQTKQAGHGAMCRVPYHEEFLKVFRVTNSVFYTVLSNALVEYVSFPCAGKDEGAGEGVITVSDHPAQGLPAVTFLLVQWLRKIHETLNSYSAP